MWCSAAAVDVQDASNCSNCNVRNAAVTQGAVLREIGLDFPGPLPRRLDHSVTLPKRLLFLHKSLHVYVHDGRRTHELD